MTTFEPGASEVFTHGLIARPLSTAFLASSAAPIITDGFDVLVHEVIAAITTAPWSSSNVAPSARVTGDGPARAPVGAVGGGEDRRVRGLVLGLAAGRGRVAGGEGLLDGLVDGRVPGRGVVRVVGLGAPA